MDHIDDRNSEPSESRVHNGSPLGASDLPGYSMFQERAPWTLVTGEEHFTYSGYHTMRLCQA